MRPESAKHYWIRDEGNDGRIECAGCGMRIGWSGATAPCQRPANYRRRQSCAAEHVPDDEVRELIAAVSKESAEPTYSLTVEWEFDGGRHRRSW